MKKRIKDTYALKLVASRWQIDALRRQLRPHFIYNTLEHLRGMALFSGNNELSDQIMELAQILRYDTRGGMYSVVSEEIEMLSHYTHIVQARTGDRFQVHINCEEELLSAGIPRMMLQPLVENAIQHGVNDILCGGQVDIDLRKSADGRMSITVNDNGVGMTSQRLEELKKILQDVNSSMADVGVGLISTIRRIKLMYKEKASYVLKSTLREGTTIQILIPIEEVRACER
jgi:two-component system sensor histidine kinase YesM